MASADTIAAIKKRIAAICATALSPYNKLTAKISRLSRNNVAWAVRRQNRVAYFALVSWFPLLMIGLTLWVALIWEPPENSPLPILEIVKRWLLVVLMIMHGLNRYEDVKRQYRRLFRRKHGLKV